MKKIIKQSIVILALLTTNSAFSLDLNDAKKCVEKDPDYSYYHNEMIKASYALIFPEKFLTANMNTAKDCNEYKDIIAILYLGLHQKIKLID